MTERTRGSVGVFPEIGIYSGPVPFDEHPEIQKYDYFAFLELQTDHMGMRCAVRRR